MKHKIDINSAIYMLENDRSSLVDYMNSLDPKYDIRNIHELDWEEGVETYDEDKNLYVYDGMIIEYFPEKDQYKPIRKYDGS